MQPVLSVAAIKKVEQAWARRHEGSTWPLMVRAGESVARLARRRWPEARRICVLAGRGNNGGDGYVAARDLLNQGLEVCVVAPSGEPRSGGDAYRACQEFKQDGGNVQRELPTEPIDLVVDAVIGTGHKGQLKPDLAAFFQAVRDRRLTVLAVDIPSGLEGATGRADSQALMASATLCLIAYKPGHLTGDGPALCGEQYLETLAIDIDAQAADWSRGYACYQQEPPPWPTRTGDSHKGLFGTVRVVAGVTGMGGAGLLAARAALSAGAGRVIWHTEPAQAQAALVAQPELMSGALDPESIPDDAICVLGSGLGLGDLAATLYESLLNRPQQSGVLDADGLTWLSREPQPVPGWVLTPHPGEAAKLLHASARDVQMDRCQAAIDLSERYQATVVLKGAGSLIAANGRLLFSHPGTPAMATPGMGDVLAGVIASLLAQGQDLRTAALTGAWWHAAIATERAQNRRLVLATEVITRLSRSQSG